MAEVIVALDLPSRESALEMVERVGPRGTFYKVGLELFTAAGPEVVRELRDRDLRVFLDLKLHDIPHTVARAVEAAARWGVELLTVHASGGRAMLEAAAEAAAGPASGATGGGPRILAVTVLTSLSAADLGEVWAGGGGAAEEADVEADVEAAVLRRARLAVAAGAHGVVASPLETGPLRAALGPGPLVVTPGIRLAGGERHDQTRVATPGEAVRAGADYLVVGRAVTRAADPAEALDAVLGDAGGTSGGGR